MKLYEYVLDTNYLCIKVNTFDSTRDKNYYYLRKGKFINYQYLNKIPRYLVNKHEALYDSNGVYFLTTMKNCHKAVEKFIEYFEKKVIPQSESDLFDVNKKLNRSKKILEELQNGKFKGVGKVVEWERNNPDFESDSERTDQTLYQEQSGQE